MYNIKHFPGLRLSENASGEDRAFLQEMRRIKERSGARYLNFSVFRNRFDQTEALYFITYPREWVAHYIESNYAEIDPLLTFDYQNVTLLDWHDIYRNKQVARFFDEFRQRGYGNHGLLCSHQIDHGLFGVSNFCFNITDQEWREHKTERCERSRFLSITLSNAYQNIYLSRAIKSYKITPRERECLYWVAVGKTDEEIGRLLNIGKWTVVSHLKSAKDKLNCANRSAAVAKALTTGIIRLLV